MMLVDERIGEVPVGREGAQRAHLINAHEAAVACHIGMQNRGQLALDAERFHRSLFSTSHFETR